MALSLMDLSIRFILLAAATIIMMIPTTLRPVNGYINITDFNPKVIGILGDLIIIKGNGFASRGNA
jgi:hypothetical protein